MNTHSIAWIRATASCWGFTTDDDLDDRVCLTETAPVRVRIDTNNCLAILIDRDLSLKTLRAGTHTQLRLEFKPGQFFEIAINGLDYLCHGSITEIRPS